jgi:hypothetical protein
MKTFSVRGLDDVLRELSRKIGPNARTGRLLIARRAQKPTRSPMPIWERAAIAYLAVARYRFPRVRSPGPAEITDKQNEEETQYENRTPLPKGY